MKRKIIELDTTDDKVIKVSMFEAAQKKHKITEIYKGKDALSALSKFFNKFGVKTQELRGIRIAQGIGRFSRTREALTIANTIAAVSGAVAVSFIPDSAVSEVSAEKKLAFKKQRRKFALPIYSAPPNINK